MRITSQDLVNFAVGGFWAYGLAAACAAGPVFVYFTHNAPTLPHYCLAAAVSLIPFAVFVVSWRCYHRNVGDQEPSLEVMNPQTWEMEGIPIEQAVPDWQAPPTSSARTTSTSSSNGTGARTGPNSSDYAGDDYTANAAAGRREFNVGDVVMNGAGDVIGRIVRRQSFMVWLEQARRDDAGNIQLTLLQRDLDELRTWGHFSTECSDDTWRLACERGLQTQDLADPATRQRNAATLHNIRAAQHAITNLRAVADDYDRNPEPEPVSRPQRRTRRIRVRA